MVLPEEDDHSSGTTKPSTTPKIIVNLKMFQRIREMEQGSWGRGQYLQLEVLGCLVRAGEQINGDHLVVIHVLLSKSGEHSGYVGGVGLSVNLKGRHGFEFLLNSKPQQTKKNTKTGNPKLRIWKLEVRRRPGRVCKISSIELSRRAGGRKAQQERKRRQERRAMSEDETERDFIEPMERELDTIASSFPFFKLRKHEPSFRKKSRKVARATERRKLLAHTWGSAFLFFCFFTSGISPEIEIEN